MLNRLSLLPICGAWLCAWALSAGGGVLLAQPDSPAAADPPTVQDNLADVAERNSGPMLKEPHEWKSDLAIFTFVVFLCLFALLAKFAWGPIARGLERREQGIADNIAAAAASAEKAERLTAEYEAKLASAADEVRVMIEEARRDADHTRQEIIADARAAAEAERTRTLREINTAKDSALKELATLAANQAVELAGRVVRTKLTPEEQSGLVRTALENLPAAEPSKN